MLVVYILRRELASVYSCFHLNSSPKDMGTELPAASVVGEGGGECNLNFLHQPNRVADLGGVSGM